MFPILTLALLPLGLIALFASLQASRTADLEKAALLNVAANESARKLVAGIAADRSALRLVVNTLAENPNRTDLCQRADEILRNRGDTVEFVVYQRGREQPLCASVKALSLGLPAAQRFRTEPATILPDRKALVVRTASNGGQLMAIAIYRSEEHTSELQSLMRISFAV